MSTIDPLAARLAHLVKSQGSAPGAAGATAAPSFDNLLQSAIKDTLETSRQAEATAMQGMLGDASVREVVEAVTQAELGLQTASAVRDRVIAAYQDIIRMPI